MGGEERVERQHASGRLTVRERIERLFDAGTFHETGALAGRGSYDERRRADRLPAGEHGRRPGAHRRPPRGRPGRRLHRPRRRRRRRDLGEDRLRRAHGARPAPPARPARRRHRRRRQRQDARGHGVLVRAAAARLRPRRREPLDRAGRGRCARPGRRARRRAGRLLALLGDRQGHRAAVRGGAAGGRDGRAWARRPTRRSWAARGCRRAPGRSTTWPPTRTTRSTSSSASSPTSRQTCGRRRRSSTPRDPADRPRGGARLDRPARPAPRVQDAPRSSRRCSTAARCSSSAPRFGASDDHVPRAARRPPGRRARVGPRALRRRRHGGRRREDGPLRGHLRPVPPAGRELRGRARLRDRHRRPSARARSGAARAACSRSSRRACRGCRSWCARSTASRAPATATARG